MAVNPIQKNLDQYLTDVTNFIDIKPNDYKKAKAIFDSVFTQIKTNMGDKCDYFKNYSKEVLYAGSVYDKIKISKLDEFDMDIVIRLPVNYNNIEIENYAPGFVRMKIKELEDLASQNNWETRNKVTRHWRDKDHYFLQNKFRQWIHGIVTGVLGDMKNRVTVDTKTYRVEYKESGPAYTLNIRNVEDNEPFELDVDLVPVIKFMHPRWPPGPYRSMSESFYWLVVPKPNKALADGEEKNRCWRLSFQEYERNMMKGCYQLKPTIRLVKKLRDTVKMKEIASYYIKNLFLWKIYDKKEKSYWKKKGLSVTFRIMVQELHNALQKRSIPYFWHEQNNLIGNVKPTVLDTYVNHLKEVLISIDQGDVDRLVTYLLNPREMQDFKKSEYYDRQPRMTRQSYAQLVSASECPNQFKEIVDLLKDANTNIGALHRDSPKKMENKDNSEDNAVGILKKLDNKFDKMNKNLVGMSKDLKTLELVKGIKKAKSNDNHDETEGLNESLNNMEVTFDNSANVVVGIEDDTIGETLVVLDKGSSQKIQHAEISSNQASKKKYENDKVLAILVEYNERLKKFEESKGFMKMNSKLSYKNKNDNTDISLEAETISTENNNINITLSDKQDEKNDILDKTNKHHEEDNSGHDYVTSRIIELNRHLDALDESKILREEHKIKCETESKNKCRGKGKPNKVNDTVANQVNEKSDAQIVEQNTQRAEPSTSRVDPARANTAYNYNYVDGVLTCPQCAQQFSRKSGYGSHMRAHSRAEQQSPPT